MNAPVTVPVRCAPERRKMTPEIGAALRAYDTAKTDRERHRALADLARARGEERSSTDLAIEAQRVIDQLAARWTAWRETSP